MSHHCGRYEGFTNRRDFLKKAGAGFGLLALADLLQIDGLLNAGGEPSLDSQLSTNNSPMAPRQPHYPARAKSVIWLFMEGAPSSVDLFDPKPELTKRDGQRIDIAQRVIQGVVRMGFLGPVASGSKVATSDDFVTVRLAMGWTGVDASYGSVWYRPSYPLRFR